MQAGPLRFLITIISTAYNENHNFSQLFHQQACNASSSPRHHRIPQYLQFSIVFLIFFSIPQFSSVFFRIHLYSSVFFTILNYSLAIFFQYSAVFLNFFSIPPVFQSNAQNSSLFFFFSILQHLSEVSR